MHRHSAEFSDRQLFAGCNFHIAGLRHSRCVGPHLRCARGYACGQVSSAVQSSLCCSCTNLCLVGVARVRGCLLSWRLDKGLDQSFLLVWVGSQARWHHAFHRVGRGCLLHVDLAADWTNDEGQHGLVTEGDGIGCLCAARWRRQIARHTAARGSRGGIDEYNRALNAVTTALVGGVAGQGAGQVASNALAPYAAHFIGSTLDPNHGSDPNATLQLLSHAVLGALLAEADGGSAGTGAVSAAGGELAAKVLTNTLTGGDPSKLSPEQKEMVLALSQAVGALAGGLSEQKKVTK
ncbi:hypothetical protein HGQ62_01105 [Stenotrophomonas maltophilia]|nr:hypothetical protein [Stenotrophomonas maltophilia]NMT73254.1 hypothetical protein [Stenotrophomonas maltophilia]